MKCTHRARLQDLIHAEEHQEDQTAKEDVHEHPVNDDIEIINSVTEHLLKTVHTHPPAKSTNISAINTVNILQCPKLGEGVYVFAMNDV